jgi:methylmalonyl-CoA mutase
MLSLYFSFQKMKEEGFNRLFSEFPQISTVAWEEKLRADLKAAGFQQDLIWESDEGIRVKPFYRKEDLDGLEYLEHAGSLKAGGSAPNSWTICQDLSQGMTPAEANTRIKAALGGGAQAVRVRLSDTTVPGPGFLETLFDGIPLEGTELLFQGYLGADAFYDRLIELASGKGIHPLALKGSLGADPIGKMVSTGIPIASMENLGKLVRKVMENSPGLRVIDVDGALIHNAGATLVGELGFALAMASEYLAILTSRGIGAADVIPAMQLSLATGPNYFMEIAKLRAARILWGRICEAYGLDPLSGRIPLHATSSSWNMTLYDPYMNMLRGTTEAMSAILGGADLISVLPFDHPYGNSTGFSDRIARNVQLILRDEAYFDRVSDPSSGSYYIESLTDAVAEKSWDLFRETEAKGGFIKAFESGWVQECVLASRQKKMDQYASGERHLLGTNAFPFFNEMILDHLSSAGQAEMSGSPLVPLSPFRVASLIEATRLETERMKKRPKVFLFKFGDPFRAAARANFAGNLLGCAGYEILDQPAFDSIGSGIAAARKAKPDMVVLCSSDDNYRGMAPAVMEALAESAVIVVAGYPEEELEALRKAGIEHFINTGSHLLETLRQFNRLLSGR